MTLILDGKKLCIMQSKFFAFLLATSGLLFCFAIKATAQTVWNPDHSIASSSGVYSYPYNTTPAALIEKYAPTIIPISPITYSWWSSSSPSSGFAPILGATSSSYTPPALTSASTTMYYYRMTTSPQYGSISSNIIKISVVSVNWEDINYIREHDVITTAQTSWTAIDQLTIGSKLQTTTYLDGLGRSIEKINKQTATPPSGSTTW